MPKLPLPMTEEGPKHKFSIKLLGSNSWSAPVNLDFEHISLLNI
jgi:hypothetical protein